jgi:SOS response regulatory protein OraA/RecX
MTKYKIREKRYIMENTYEKALKYCLNLLAKQDYSLQDLSGKLMKRGVDENIIRKVSEYLTAKGYINDEALIKRIIEKYTVFEPSGRLLIAQKLEHKGFAEAQYSGLLSKLSEETLALQSAKLRKKKKTADKDRFNSDEYWFKYLTSKGFDYDIIEKIIYAIKEEK